MNPWYRLKAPTFLLRSLKSLYATLPVDSQTAHTLRRAADALQRYQAHGSSYQQQLVHVAT